MQAGADLRQQAKVFHVGGGGFRALTRRSRDGTTNTLHPQSLHLMVIYFQQRTSVSLDFSSVGIPSISIVFGSSTAGGAYSPGMSDYVIMVKVHSFSFTFTRSHSS
jgi:hypothetical protein